LPFNEFFAEDGHQNFRHDNSLVCLLVLHNAAQGPLSSAECAVEHVDKLFVFVAAFVAEADVGFAADLVGGVGARLQLPPLELTREPGLQVVLDGSCIVECLAHDEDRTLTQPQFVHELLASLDHHGVFSVGSFRGRDAEHFDFLELVDAEDASGVLAVGSSLFAEARRESALADRQLRRLHVFIGVDG